MPESGPGSARGACGGRKRGGKAPAPAQRNGPPSMPFTFKHGGHLQTGGPRLVSISGPFRRVAGLSVGGRALGSHEQGLTRVFHLFPQGQDEGLLPLAGKGECGDAEAAAAGVAPFGSASAPLPRLPRLSLASCRLPREASASPSPPRPPRLLSALSPSPAVGSLPPPYLLAIIASLASLFASFCLGSSPLASPLLFISSDYHPLPLSGACFLSLSYSSSLLLPFASPPLYLFSSISSSSPLPLSNEEEEEGRYKCDLPFFLSLK